MIEREFGPGTRFEMIRKEETFVLRVRDGIVQSAAPGGYQRYVGRRWATVAEELRGEWVIRRLKPNDRPSYLQF